MPAFTYPDDLARAMAEAPSVSRASAGKSGAGASSMSFWWRRWIVQSRSPRNTTLPWVSAMSWASM